MNEWFALKLTMIKIWIMRLKIAACYVYVYHHTFIESESFKNLIPCKYTCVQTGKVQWTGIYLFDTYQIYVANVYDAIFQPRYI